MTVANTTKNNLQDHMVCEGTKTVTGFSVRWSNRWLAIGRGYSPADVIDQFINIAMPANGTVIPRSTGAAGSTVDTNGILLGAWETLYWRQNVNGGVNSGSFIIVPYSDNYVGGENEVWVAKRVGNQHIEWADRSKSNEPYVAPVAFDFWRNAVSGAANANTNLPDGATDWSQSIQRRGKLGVGFVQAQTPVAMIDIASGNRSGTDHRNAADPLYVTGAINAGSTQDAPSPNWFDSNVKAFIGHDNQTAGFAFGWQTIQQVGQTTHDFILALSGNGNHVRQWGGYQGGYAQSNEVIAAAAGWAGNNGWYKTYQVGATVHGGDYVRRAGAYGAGAQNGMERFWQQRDSQNVFRNAMALRPSLTNASTFSLFIDHQNLTNEAKMVWWGNGSRAGSYLSGIRNAERVESIPNGGSWRWRNGTNDNIALAVSAIGNVTIDAMGLAAAGWSTPVLRFGGEGSNEGIHSQRTGAGRFLGGMEIHTGGLARLAVLPGGRIYMSNVPTFASDAAAGTSGLASGEVWKDATGILHIKL